MRGSTWKKIAGWWALWALVIGVWLSLHGQADACSYSPVYAELLTDRVAPRGVVVVRVSCVETTYCETATPEIRVGQGDDALPGAVELLRGESGETEGVLLARCPRGVAVADGEERPQVRVQDGVPIRSGRLGFFVDPV